MKYFKNERLMMTEEEARNRAKELLNENQVDLITKYMFLEQQCKKQKEIIDKAIEYIKENSQTNPNLSGLLIGSEIENLLDILKEVSELMKNISQ